MEQKCSWHRLPIYKLRLPIYKLRVYIKSISRVSCQKGPTRHAYAWPIGPFWQDTLDIYKTQFVPRFSEYWIKKPILYESVQINMILWQLQIPSKAYCPVTICNVDYQSVLINHETCLIENLYIFHYNKPFIPNAIQDSHTWVSKDIIFTLKWIYQLSTSWLRHSTCNFTNAIFNFAFLYENVFLL